MRYMNQAEHEKNLAPSFTNLRTFLTCKIVIQILRQNKLSFLLKIALYSVKEDLKPGVKPYDLAYILDNPILVYLDCFIDIQNFEHVLYIQH